MRHSPSLPAVVRMLMNQLSKKQKQGFTLIELLVVVVIIGILASVALPSFVGAQDKARNSTVAANVHTVQMGVEQYATEHNGSYPTISGGAAGNEFINVLTSASAGLLPGDKMPRSPWSVNPSQIQQNTLGANAAGLADSKTTSGLTAANFKLGTGLVPTGTTFAKEWYGAIEYDADPNTNQFVLYGTGKRGKDAVVTAGVSNFGQ